MKSQLQKLGLHKPSARTQNVSIQTQLNSILPNVQRASKEVLLNNHIRSSTLKENFSVKIMQPVLRVEPSNSFKNNYVFLLHVGTGSFGKVWKVQDRRTKQIYALKEMSKEK
jgi:hypothetical protein